ncbi:MAG: hypothetical protein JXC33_08835, partial [Deltaproteobacteria bacterium]|nr:hypothetical protein [Deltaproteobacteria bacterium]
MQNIATIETNTLCDGIDLSILFGRKKTSRFTDFINNKSDDLLSRFNTMVTPLLSYKTKKIDSIDKGTVYLEKGIEMNYPAAELRGIIAMRSLRIISAVRGISV